MRAGRLARSVLVPCIAAALVLPYGAPAVCGLVRRAAAPTTEAMEHCARAQASDPGASAAWSAPRAVDGRCDFAQCTLALTAPDLSSIPELPSSPIVTAVISERPSSPITQSIPPLTPPPQA